MKQTNHTSATASTWQKSCHEATHITHWHLRASVVLALTLSTLLQAACSSDLLYASGRNAQRSECLKHTDAAARERCLKDANTSYDTYRKEADAARQ